VSAGKPSSLIRPNVRNGMRTKKRLSTDYRPATLDLGGKGFKDHVAKQRDKKRLHPPQRPARSPGLKGLRDEALAAFSHYVKHGDHTAMSRMLLYQSSVRTRNTLIKWFECVSKLRWEQASQRFRGRPDRARLSLDVARDTPIVNPGRSESAAGQPLLRRPISRLRTTTITMCAVCWHPAMPGENTCYHHHNK
jgi:hypothetical protein